MNLIKENSVIGISTEIDIPRISVKRKYVMLSSHVWHPFIFRLFDNVQILLQLYFFFILMVYLIGGEIYRSDIYMRMTFLNVENVARG